MFYRIFNVHGYLIALLVASAVIGDYFASNLKLHVYRALFDNVTHATVGGLSWLIIRVNIKHRYLSGTLFEIALCTLIASCIDLDHFFAARSLSLHDATNLQSRPPLHSSTAPFFVTVFLVLFSYFLQFEWLQKLSLITFVAFASHHTRDATRRGYWFYPFGSTPPIPYIMYIAITVAIPYLVSFSMPYLAVEKTVNKTTIAI